jgi:hypothetical protein
MVITWIPGAVASAACEVAMACSTEAKLRKITCGA